MNKRTIYTLPKGTEPNGTNLKALIDLHQSDVSVFYRLESYVDDNPDMGRTSPNELLTTHNFAQYITSINTGYLLGNPVDYKSESKTKALDPITENYNGQTIAELDTELEEDCSMFGQAFENVFTDETSTAMSAKLSVYNTIVVYDNTFKHDKMFALYYSQVVDDKGSDVPNKYDLTIWTDTTISYHTLTKDELTDDPEQAAVPHFFKVVPVVHYMNNRRLKGDYEPVISLIDAYNILQSDRVIDREKLVDAILAFYGSKVSAEDQKAIKDNRVVGLPEGSKAEFIVKQIDEQGADVLRQTLAADIHKFSMTPDLTDETFGAASSGVSILYKLLAFEQNIKTKERLFERSLLNRFALYVTVLSVQSKLTGGNIDIKTVDAIFTRSLPKNNFETSQMINNLEGLVSNETLISQLDFVQDASAEVEKVAEEKPDTGDFATNNFTKETV